MAGVDTGSSIEGEAWSAGAWPAIKAASITKDTDCQGFMHATCGARSLQTRRRGCGGRTSFVNVGAYLRIVTCAATLVFLRIEEGMVRPLWRSVAPDMVALPD